MGRQVDRPRPERLEQFRRMLGVHSRVGSVVEMSEQLFRIERIIGCDVTVYITDFYTISECELLEILEKDPAINCVIAASEWNQYTPEAKDFALAQKKGLFTFREFMGALNWNEFWKYELPKRDDR